MCEQRSTSQRLAGSGPTALHEGRRGRQALQVPTRHPLRDPLGDDRRPILGDPDLGRRSEQSSAGVGQPVGERFTCCGFRRHGSIHQERRHRASIRASDLDPAALLVEPARGSAAQSRPSGAAPLGKRRARRTTSARCTRLGGVAVVSVIRRTTRATSPGGPQRVRVSETPPQAQGQSTQCHHGYKPGHHQALTSVLAALLRGVVLNASGHAPVRVSPCPTADDRSRARDGRWAPWPLVSLHSGTERHRCEAQSDDDDTG
jgi:hypothetical protein